MNEEYIINEFEKDLKRLGIKACGIMSIIFLVIFITCNLSGCNKQIVDLNYKFNKAYINTGNNEVLYVDVEKWNDYEQSDMVQVVDKNGNIYLTHSTNVVLVYDKGK